MRNATLPVICTMYISEHKKDENIAEYILYMWQIEDIIRSCNFNISIIERNVISNFASEAPAMQKIKQWYEHLIFRMEKEKVTERGHLEEICYILYELSFLHNSLINIFQDKQYIELHHAALPNIKALQHRSNSSQASDVETCLIGLYGMFLLQIQKKTITPATTEAMKTFSKLMAYLSFKYKDLKTGVLQLPVAIQN